MNPKLIVIDRKTCTSVDEMPEDVRRQYEQAISSLKDQDRNHFPEAFENISILADKDKDGLPDLFENISSNVVVSGTTKIIVDRKEFNRLEDLPPDIRADYEQLLGKLNGNQNGMPVFLEGMINTSVQIRDDETSFGTETPRRSKPFPVSRTMTPDTSNGLTLALVGFLTIL